MSRQRPLWRSLLYVPTHVEKFVASAHTRGADAIILDLEDAVPPDEKVRARSLVQSAAERVGQAGADVLVRINAQGDLAAEDIAAAVSPKVMALALPKVESAQQLLRTTALVAEAEARRGLPDGHTGFYVLIESAAGFLQMAEIARATPRVVALALGGEDFCADVGMEPSEETLLGPRQALIIAAAAAGVMPLGVVGVATRFDDPEAYLAMARRSRRYGFAGSSGIHPSQIPLLNAAFSPSAKEIEMAARIVAGAEAATAAGRGAFAIDGQMIDAPIVARAQTLLDRQAAIEARARRIQIRQS
jgi:citrate lyase subunit beta / citryl-CoA lyase